MLFSAGVMNTTMPHMKPITQIRIAYARAPCRFCVACQFSAKSVSMITFRAASLTCSCES